MASNLPHFNVVCEGPSDYFVIEAALAAILDNADFTLQQIQPLASLYGGNVGPYGGGWKGVRAWCEATRRIWGSVGRSRKGIAGELLIIHLDADVADESEIDCAEVCPPASATVERLRTVLLGWMGDIAMPDWIIFCTPSKAVDAWVLVALYPNDEWAKTGVECRAEPARHLLNKPEKLVRLRDERLQKNGGGYRRVGDIITRKWPSIQRPLCGSQQFRRRFPLQIAFSGIVNVSGCLGHQ